MSVTDEPMHVNFCGTHAKEIERDYVTYQILRCPLCLDAEIDKAYQQGLKDGAKPKEAHHD